MAFFDCQSGGTGYLLNTELFAICYQQSTTLFTAIITEGYNKVTMRNRFNGFAVYASNSTSSTLIATIPANGTVSGIDISGYDVVYCIGITNSQAEIYYTFTE